MAESVTPTSCVPPRILEDIQVVVFDLDDTLYPECEFVKSGFRAVSAHLLESGVSGEDLFGRLWETFCRGVRGTVFNEVLSGAGVACDEDLVRTMVDVYRLHAPVLCLYPDAADLLKHLYGRTRLALPALSAEQGRRAGNRPAV
jgi:putative hydrolase of the HAD superfamily